MPHTNNQSILAHFPLYEKSSGPKHHGNFSTRISKRLLAAFTIVRAPRIISAEVIPAGHDSLVQEPRNLLL